MSPVRWLVAFAPLAIAGHSVAADGDIAWEHRHTQRAVTLTANPLGAASRTAFYTARGFTEAAIRPYAQACGFSFGMQNGGAATLVTRLTDWRAIDRDGRSISLLLPQAWDAEWDKAGVTRAARIAFRWAQFQSENVFAPGDWIMGMATLEAMPAGPFRLVARYQDEMGIHEIVLDRLDCVRD
ncbi:MAG: hypothetical protein HZC22_01315 [Rhodocyclales bacterium]|nr:hypothetical protein [Rhodocyclales bacterium]